MSNKEKEALIAKIESLGKELEEADKTNDILQLENDDLRTEVMKADQRTSLIIEEIGSKVDKILEAINKK